MLTENWLLCVCEFERGERLKSKGNFSQLRDKFSRSDSLKEKGRMGGGRSLASTSAPQDHGGVPSTARPSHLGGRASGTWPDKEKSESGDEIGIWLATNTLFSLRCV